MHGVSVVIMVHIGLCGLGVASWNFTFRVYRWKCLIGIYDGMVVVGGSFCRSFCDLFCSRFLTGFFGCVSKRCGPFVNQDVRPCGKKVENESSERVWAFW